MNRPDRPNTFAAWASDGKCLYHASAPASPLGSAPRAASRTRYVDTQGNAAKAFVVPQQDPTHYHRCLDTFNAPELVTGRVRIDPRALANTASAGEAR